MKNNYGITHGLAVAGLVWVSFLVVRQIIVYPQVLEFLISVIPNTSTPNNIALLFSGVVGVFAPYGVVYWFRREAKARGTKKFWTWYLDSMFDFLTALFAWVTTLVAINHVTG